MDKTGQGWKTSSFCTTDAGCVEVGSLVDGTVLVRDTEGRTVRYTPREWEEFIRGVRNGEFDKI